MNLLRAAARTMLASYFIVNGVKALREPEPLVEAAEPIAKRFVPLVQKAAPTEVAGYIPDDTRTLVQINGALQIVGGLSLATGLGRRFGSGLLALSMIPHVLASNPLKAGADKAAAQSQLVKNIALLGGVVLAAQDTEGRPGLVWRAGHEAERLGRGAARTKDQIARDAQRTARQLTREARHAKATLAREAKLATVQARQLAHNAQRSIESALS